MPYRIKRDLEGVGGVGEYHYYRSNPPAHTLSKEWETVDELPQSVKDDETALFAQPSKTEQLEARIMALEAKIK